MGPVKRHLTDDVNYRKPQYPLWCGARNGERNMVLLAVRVSVGIISATTVANISSCGSSNAHRLDPDGPCHPPVQWDRSVLEPNVAVMEVTCTGTHTLWFVSTERSSHGHLLFKVRYIAVISSTVYVYNGRYYRAATPSTSSNQAHG